jgi:hypothetical protein
MTLIQPLNPRLVAVDANLGVGGPEKALTSPNTMKQTLTPTLQMTRELRSLLEDRYIVQSFRPTNFPSLRLLIPKYFRYRIRICDCK